MTSIRVKNELLLINLCSLVLIAVISLADVWVLRVVLGLPFLLFFPGYTLIATLFPRKEDIGTTERVALSITLSVIISPVVGFVLNFLWEIDLYPILIGLTVFTAAMSTVAWCRRRGIAQEDRLEIALNFPFQVSGRLSRLDRVVSIILVLVFLGAIVTLGYVVANPREGERFTEFYVRGAESRPTELTAGDAAIVTLGIANRELETLTYRIEVRVEETLVKTTEPVSLGHGGEWEGEVSFAPGEVCAQTELTQDAGGTDNSSLPEVKSIQVGSVERLAAGDKIWVGQEAAVVQEVTGNTVAITEALKENHAAGTEVMEVQRVEFRLLKIRQIGEQGETSLSLWVGKDHLEADVLNQSQGPAAYQIALIIRESYQEGEERFESAVQSVAAGGEWTQETDYRFSENHEIEFSLYKDAQLVYRKLESGGYPSLHLWIHVK